MVHYVKRHLYQSNDSLRALSVIGSCISRHPWHTLTKNFMITNHGRQYLSSFTQSVFPSALNFPQILKSRRAGPMGVDGMDAVFKRARDGDSDPLAQPGDS